MQALPPIVARKIEVLERPIKKRLFRKLQQKSQLTLQRKLLQLKQLSLSLKLMPRRLAPQLAPLRKSLPRLLQVALRRLSPALQDLLL